MRLDASGTTTVCLVCLARAAALPSSEIFTVPPLPP
jgi:hypothetical protein